MVTIGRIPFGRLDADVPKQELNLFEFSPGMVSQTYLTSARFCLRAVSVSVLCLQPERPLAAEEQVNQENQCVAMCFQRVSHVILRIHFATAFAIAFSVLTHIYEAHVDQDR
jgi:hypothetical protein